MLYYFSSGTGFTVPAAPLPVNNTNPGGELVTSAPADGSTVAAPRSTKPVKEQTEPVDFSGSQTPTAGFPGSTVTSQATTAFSGVVTSQAVGFPVSAVTSQSPSAFPGVVSSQTPAFPGVVSSQTAGFPGAVSSQSNGFPASRGFEACFTRGSTAAAAGADGISRYRPQNGKTRRKKGNIRYPISAFISAQAELGNQ